MEKKTKYAILALAIIALFAGTVAFVTPPIEISYPGGWEVQANNKKVVVNQKAYTSTSRPNNTYSWGDAYVLFDVDSEKTGVPNIAITVYDPIEYILDPDGDWMKARPGETFKILQKKSGNDIFYFYHHVFFFDLQVIADPDFVDVPRTNTGEARGMMTFIPPVISVFIEFKSNLWQVYGTISSDNGTATYRNTGVWAGVMSAEILDDGATGKYVDTPPDDIDQGYPGWWSLTNVGPLNMYTLNNSWVYPTTDTGLVDSPLRIAGVPSSVLIEVAGTTLWPGWRYPPGGTCGVYAVEADYRIRGDIVTGAKYTFEQGDLDDTANNASIQKNDTDPWGDWWRDWTSSLGNWLKSLGPNLIDLGVFVIIALVLVLLIKRTERKRR